MRRLAELRRKNQMSQFDLAEKLGLSQQTISKYERGLIEPDFNTLTIVAHLFDTSVDYLMELSNLPNYDDVKHIPDPLYMKLAHEAQDMHLSETDVGYIVDFIKHFKERNKK